MQKIYRKIYRFMNYIYKSLLRFCLWREIPLKLLKVYTINVQDCRYIISIMALLKCVLCKKSFSTSSAVRQHFVDDHLHYSFTCLIWSVNIMAISKESAKILNVSSVLHVLCATLFIIPTRLCVNLN